VKRSWLSRSIPLLIVVNVIAALVHVWTVIALAQGRRS
jgi:hypothetical protein